MILRHVEEAQRLFFQVIFFLKFLDNCFNQSIITGTSETLIEPYFITLLVRKDIIPSLEKDFLYLYSDF